MINYTVDQHVAIITWAMTSTPMNVLNDESIPAFDAALQRAYADDSVTGIIITSNKPEFVAGADLKMILRNNDKDPVDMMPLSLELNRIFRRIETAGKPTVAAINGTALGGGYEICLACHHRIALNNPKALVGLVEVTIGLLPGAGGTQRLPRMLGFEVALPLILEGKKVGVQEAKQLGMIDDLAESPGEMMQKAHAWIAADPTPVKPWDEVDRKTGKIIGRDRFTPPGGDVLSTIGTQTFSAQTAGVMTETNGNYPAPLEIIACIYEGLQVDIDQGLMIEARHFAKVATSKVARNLIQTMFLGLNEVNKGVRRPKDIPRTDVGKLVILGADQIGMEVAHVSALAGIQVVLNDASTEPTANAQDFGECDLLIEAASEDRTLKLQVMNEVEPTRISEAADAAVKPDQFVGIRFGLPVDRAPLVEVVTSSQTSDYALAVAMDYVRKIRKTPLVVNDSPGGYVARCLTAYASEGRELLREGVNPELIENAGKMVGMLTGPLAVPNHSVLNSTQTTFGLPGLTETINHEESHGQTDYQPTLDEVKTRLLHRQVMEAVRCFDESVISTKLEADLGSILGWGFPSYTGGALSFIDFVGIDTFVKTGDRLADTYGERFRPTERLRERAS